MGVNRHQFKLDIVLVQEIRPWGLHDFSFECCLTHLFSFVRSVECPGIEAAQDHIKGKSHKRKLNLVSGGEVKAAASAATPCPPNGAAAAPPSGEAAALAPNVAAAGALPSLPGFRCEICQIETTDLAGLEQHKNGKKHKKKAAAAFLAEAKKEST